jgi:hypothetical protein
MEFRFSQQLIRILVSARIVRAKDVPIGDKVIKVTGIKKVSESQDGSAEVVTKESDEPSAQGEIPT